MANKRLNAVITIGGAVAGSLRSAFGTVTAETNKVGSAIQRLTERQRQLNAELERVGRSGSNAASLRVQYANQELATIGRQIALLQRRQALERAGVANKARRSEIGGKIGGTMMAGAMVMAPLGAAINEAATFDYELQLIGNTAEMNKKQVGELGTTILQVSKDTQQSATNIRKGMGFLIAAGMPAQQASLYLGTIGKTATATNAEVEDLSKMVFTLADSLKIKPDGMLSAIDTLTQAGKEGNVELKDMAKQLPVLGSGFVSLKMEGREAAATMGAALQIARKGASDADEAANNMKNFIAKIMSPETLKKAKKHFNLDLYKIIQDAQKSGGNPFEAAMLAIAKATKGDQKAIGEMFSDMQVQNFLRPMIQNWDEYKRVKDKSLAANGVVDHDYQAMLQTTKQQMNELANAAGRLAIALGSVFTASTGDKSTGLAARIGQLADFITAHKELVATTAKVVGGLFAMRLAVLGVSYAYTLATGAGIAMKMMWLGMSGAGALAAGASGWMRVGAAIRFVGTSLLWVGRALLLTPIGLAITALAVGAYLVVKYWEPIKAFFIDLWAGVKSSFATVWDWIVDKIGWLITAPIKIGQKVGALIGRGGNTGGATGDWGSDSPGAGGLPSVPAMAGRGGVVVHDNSQTTIQVAQQPGQNSTELAREIQRELARMQGVRTRSRLPDGVGAQ
jgi:TP901 family phage tail tape measure protein